MTKLEFDRHFNVAPGMVERISPLVRRVLCNNPSPFTFKGTSTFIVGHGQVAIIDPGPADETHLAALLAAVRGETVSHILVTHSHADHSPLANKLMAATGARTHAFGPVEAASGVGPRLDDGIDHSFTPDVRLADGNVIEMPGWTVEAIFTPGHMSNHMSFALHQEKTLFVGDHVMAWATSVVAPPDGDMAAYLDSLDKLIARGDEILYPTHGSPITGPQIYLRELLAHRRMRAAQILETLRDADTATALAAKLYPDIAPALRAAATSQVQAHLDHLAAQGMIAALPGARYAKA